MGREKSYIRVSELELRREQAIEKCGEELVLKAESRLQSLLKEAEIFMRIDADNLERVLRDGRFKSIFEIRAESTIIDSEDIAGNAENLRLRLETIASARSLADLMEAKEQHFYFEAQIHDRVTIEDIAEIIYIEDIPSDSIAQLALERGIQITVVNLNES